MSLRDHWPLHARQWALLGPPLRPDREDVAIVEREVAGVAAGTAQAAAGGSAQAARGGVPLRALLLGVTPELATMRWPAATSLIAVDRSPAMIEAIFPRAGMPDGAAAHPGEWLALPIADGAIDVVVGDGCLSNLAFPDDYRAFATECRRVLGDGGRVVLRVFAAPADEEAAARPSLAAVAEALWAGQIASVHALKWRIAIAIQPADRNVAVADILRAFDALVPDRAALAARTGWTPDAIATVDAYRGSDLRYSFPSLDEICGALGVELVPVACHGGDARRDRYPTLVWAPRR